MAKGVQLHLHLSSSFPSSFENLAGRQCSADGEMIWTKGDFGEDKYAMCYAPSLVEGAPGPTGGHISCDAGAPMFSVEAPKFCCHKPRMQNELVSNESTPAKGDLCADTLGEFDPATQRFRITRGPTTSGTLQNLASLQEAGLGDKSPSPMAFKGLKDGKEWVSLPQAKCQGHAGTLVKFKDDPDGKVEYCPTGTSPVRGGDYSSWFCDNAYTKEDRMYCCSVHGRVRCSKHLVDESNVASCHCGGLGKGEETPESTLPTKTSLLVPLVPLLSQASRPKIRPGLDRRKPRGNCHAARLAQSFL
eukprot:TRINITY_DN25084_c0_g1_i1.p1 TRINITY_DN25084_c0_g1~~TRINITY_DN25084_c0_g1_i1.p1  ORF type:complete len:303 (-),score=40.43 TRINITY_DN25084_c0_g1_i1:69-977(-)